MFFRTVFKSIYFFSYVTDNSLVFSIILGLTYNGVDDQGNIKWDGCANVNLSKFEGATSFGHYIESFNINTNHWVAE